MHSTRFSIGLIATLATAFGFTLCLALRPADATGYPAGVTISTGSNPLFSVGGAYDSDIYGSLSALSAPGDQAAIITDVAFALVSTSRHCEGEISVAMKLSDGTEVGHFVARRSDLYNDASNHSFQLQSGIVVPPGESLTLDLLPVFFDCGGDAFGFRHTLTGYYAQP